MISCKIGLISFSKKYPSISLVLGIVKTKDYKKLYQIEEDTELFTSFKVSFYKGKITINNFEDIKQFRKTHNISNDIYFINNKFKDNFSLNFNKPILYDISCMVPLFNKSHIKNKVLIKSQFKNIYILILGDDMFENNKILKNCIESLNGFDYTFILLNVNKKAKRYLSENNIKKENILEIPIENKNLEYYLSETFYILNFLKINSENSKFYIGIQSKKMNSILIHKKALEFTNKEILNFNFICE